MLYDCKKLVRFVSDAGAALGMSEKEAREFGESLVYADMRGLGSHGVMRMVHLYPAHAGGTGQGWRDAKSRSGRRRND